MSFAMGVTALVDRAEIYTIYLCSLRTFKTRNIFCERCWCSWMQYYTWVLLLLNFLVWCVTGTNEKEKKKDRSFQLRKNMTWPYKQALTVRKTQDFSIKTYNGVPLPPGCCSKKKRRSDSNNQHPPISDQIGKTSQQHVA